MNPFTMVVLIVLIGGIVRIVQTRHGVGRDRLTGEDRYLGPPRDLVEGQRGEAERLRQDLARLKDRVAVLERIVTDGDRARGLELEREIDALRDERERQR